MYEESSMKMLKAIEILKMKEKENFVLNYARDVKLAFGHKDKPMSIDEQKKVSSFEGSSI